VAENALASQTPRPASQSYLMSYKHLSQAERYQIYVLMQAGKNLRAIAQMLGRHNALKIEQGTRALVAERLSLQWSPEQIAASLPVIHETMYPRFSISPDF
jgi:IS30 family transposase